MLPSGLTAGDDLTSSPVVNDHISFPDKAFSAYTLLSLDPTKTLLPSGLTAGEDLTSSPIAKDHISFPDEALSAYTLLSLDPT
jgi:hypothetical protein